VVGKQAETLIVVDWKGGGRIPSAQKLLVMVTAVYEDDDDAPLQLPLLTGTLSAVMMPDRIQADALSTANCAGVQDPDEHVQAFRAAHRAVKAAVACRASLVHHKSPSSIAAKLVIIKIPATIANSSAAAARRACKSSLNGRSAFIALLRTPSAGSRYR
jgi:hypothetical protein